MAIRDTLIKIQLLTVLAAVLMLWFGCGGGDEAIVKTDVPTDEVISTGSLEGTIERIGGVSVTVRVPTKWQRHCLYRSGCRWKLSNR